MTSTQQKAAAVKSSLGLSFDVEVTGDAPGKGSMVQIGIAAFLSEQPAGFIVTEDNASDWIVAKKKWNLEETDGRGERCWNEFWTKHQDVWAGIQVNKVHPLVFTQELNEWLKDLSKTYNIFWLAFPAAFDWQWLNYVWQHYGPAGDEERFNLGFKAECGSAIRSVVKGLLHDEKPFLDFITPSKLVVTHDALDDATSQAYTYLKMKEWLAKSLAPSYRMRRETIATNADVMHDVCKVYVD